MVPLFLCPPISSRSLHPVLREPDSPLHTHTHTFWYTHTGKRGWAKPLTRKFTCPLSFLFSLLRSPSLRLSISTIQKSSCSSPQPLLAQRPASFNLHLATGREQWREVQKAPRPSLPHLPSLGIFHIRAQTSTLFWRSLKSLRSRGDKGTGYLSVPGFGCLEWHIFPTRLFLFFLNGKWRYDLNCNVGTQANRLDCGRTSLSKRETEGAHGKR